MPIKQVFSEIIQLEITFERNRYEKSLLGRIKVDYIMGHGLWTTSEKFESGTKATLQTISEIGDNITSSTILT